ncbi:hypothetical protein ACQP1P_10720 [Dactylosporangium sp. CA-052675]|uniref:hypothetical protein n=1 Tax=Dactylosporangium sp. CA-052675 TaxID=3239927 RepID=UPI003D92BC05
MRMRWPLAIAAWLAAAALATAASIGAVGSLSNGLFGPSDAPMSEADVEARLTPTPAGSPTPDPSAPLGTTPASPAASTATSRALSTAGGSIMASCPGGQAYLDSWIPRSGFETDHLQRGPAATASLRFKARSGGGSVRAQVTCVNGEPALALPGDD